MSRVYKVIPVEEEKPPKGKLIIEDVCKVRSRYNLPCEGCLYYKRCRRGELSSDRREIQL